MEYVLFTETMNITVTSKNNFFSKAGTTLGKNLQTALKDCCSAVEMSAKKECPVDTGFLRRSIGFEVKDNEGYVGTNCEYAPYIEFGTGKFAYEGDGRKTPWIYEDAEGETYITAGQKPKLFLHKALKSNKSYIKSEISKAVKELGNGKL